MNKKVKILIFCMIFVVGGVFGQTNCLRSFKILSSSGYYISIDIGTGKETVEYPSNKIGAKHIFTLAVKQPLIEQQPLVVIAPNYYTQNFGFFCKKELQLQKVTKVPFLFRLGSVELCDRMEGKRR